MGKRINMAEVTYILIEGSTETDDDINSFIEKIKDTLQLQFSPKKVTVAIQDYFPDGDPTAIVGGGIALDSDTSGYR
jgi:hypothetical protein